jgi:rhodanese-related sulfurtransferase
MLLPFAPSYCGIPGALAQPLPQSAWDWLQRPECYGPLAFGGALLAGLLFFRLPDILSWWRARKQPTLRPVDVEPLLAGNPPTIIDLRPPEAFGGPKGHIRGARNLAPGQLPQALAGIVQDPRHLILLVDADDKLSHAVMAQVQQGGYPWVRVLRGGMRAWRGANLPVSGPRS